METGFHLPQVVGALAALLLIAAATLAFTKRIDQPFSVGLVVDHYRKLVGIVTLRDMVLAYAHMDEGGIEAWALDRWQITDPWLPPSASVGHTDSMGIRRTFIEARFAATLAAAIAAIGLGRGAMAEPIDDGLAAFESEDYATALEILLPLAEAGDLEASYTVGVIYDFGRGVNQDDMAAGVWYRLPAENGMAEAQLAMAVLFDSGEGILQNVVEAYAWSSIAADQGLAKAERLRDSVRSVMSRLDRRNADALKAKYWDLYVAPFKN